MMGRTQKTDQTIYIVDDEPAVRDALAVVFEMEGFTVVGFETGDAFLEAAKNHQPACVFLDVHMPGRSGLDILKALNADHYPAPIFIISGQGDIPMAVTAIKYGAFDFIEKPFDAGQIVDRVREALAAQARRAAGEAHPNGVAADFPGRELLTPREIEVLGQITAGASNKEAGRHLGISPRTIEVHRARIMEKLGARNAADLVRIVLTGEHG
ncbi:response regulator transcription factor [Pinisolibacter aquiterrae]|jgi:FixJ family two-component response regulator|uniref:response regulator transcription factor n=1 Tax=Pinisolibacter aquiterrae TaxID=2815579 RepID=UPI001E51ECAA|nr:response regulator [Pinisolibacter aquiterrae]MBV5266766.1 response regulator transcription factor [Pinisolibacter aquiterrae]MCC8234921.1 response regulator [Pinisolibacter aquiterrae]